MQPEPATLRPVARMTMPPSGHPTRELPPPAPGDQRPGPLLRWADHLLGALSPNAVERGSTLLVLALGILDYSMGPDLAFTAVYLLPIAATAWYGAERSGAFLAVLAAGVGLGVEVVSVPEPLPLWMHAWNLGVRLTLLLALASIVAWLRQAVTLQRTLALSDPLTGLANTRAFFDQLEEEIGRGLRYGRIFTLAYLDLDRFKEVNDTLGHAEGDAVLQRVAKTMRTTLRSTDLPARLGGDEFGVILPETPYAQAEKALDKLRAEILYAMREEGWPVTLSLGAVTFESTVETADDAIRIADGLMYAVKDSGGDGIRHLLWAGTGS